MRAIIFLLPAILMAQAPPAKSPAPAAKAAPATKAPPAAKAATAALTTDDQKTIYAVGLSMAQ